MVLVTVLTALATEATWEYLLGQLSLALSVYVSLYILSDRPLISPIQAVVFVFYWWFGVAPVVSAVHAYLAGAPIRAIYYQETGKEALWIVAFGLPLYAIAARRTLDWLEERTRHARFLMPDGYFYKPRTLLVYWCVGWLASVAVRGLELLGIQGITEVNYLGGTRTDIWVVGVLLQMGRISDFATVSVMGYLSAPARSVPWWLKAIGVALIVQAMAGALTSGMKFAFVSLFLVIICARLSTTQRLPWRFVLLVLFLYLAIVEPFVMSARQLATVVHASTSSEREAIFLDYFLEEGIKIRSDWRDWKVNSLFRGIYPLAGEVVRTTSLLEGVWDGSTILWGLEVIVPRILSPEKPESSIGNFFSRTVGVSAGITSPQDYINSVAISIPFELVGNFGWWAGVLFFPLFGLLWTFICGWLLSASRISDHPLSPMFVIMTMGVEQPLGSFLASVRNLVMPLAVAMFLWILLRKRL